MPPSKRQFPALSPTEFDHACQYCRDELFTVQFAGHHHWSVLVAHWLRREGHFSAYVASILVCGHLVSAPLSENRLRDKHQIKILRSFGVKLIAELN